MPWVCCGSRVCSSWCVGALVGRLLHVCAMCTMCTFLMLVVQGLLLLTTPTANAACTVCGREGHNARTCPQRGTAIQPVQQQQPQGRQQGCSICGEPSHNARTHAQHAAATAAAAERTARGEYVCGYCQRVVSGEKRARWLRQLFSVACDASPHLSCVTLHAIGRNTNLSGGQLLLWKEY
jgi:hypothetical protein